MTWPGYIFRLRYIPSVPCEQNRKKVVAKRVNRYDESTDMYTEFFKPYELTSFDDTFCIAMTNSARSVLLPKASPVSPQLKYKSHSLVTRTFVWFVLGSLCQRVLAWILALSPCVNQKKPANQCWGEHILYLLPVNIIQMNSAAMFTHYRTPIAPGVVFSDCCLHKALSPNVLRGLWPFPELWKFSVGWKVMHQRKMVRREKKSTCKTTTFFWAVKTWC